MLVSCRKWRRGSIIGAAVASVAILWALPSANAAGGGGCSRASGQGFTITSCISAHFENPLSTRIFPDYYVNAIPNLQKETCSIVWALYKDLRPLGLNGGGSCVPGHVVVQYQPTDSGNYFLELQVLIGPDARYQRLILKVDSPVEFN